MSIDVSEKLKLIRESERLNRKEFSELTGVAYSSLSSYESRSKNAGVEAIMKVLQHPRFTKYTLWFMTDQVAPEAGQIAPALAHFGQNETTSPHSGQKTGQQFIVNIFITSAYYWWLNFSHHEKSD